MDLALFNAGVHANLLESAFISRHAGR